MWAPPTGSVLAGSPPPLFWSILSVTPHKKVDAKIGWPVGKGRKQSVGLHPSTAADQAKSKSLILPSDLRISSGIIVGSKVLQVGTDVRPSRFSLKVESLVRNLVFPTNINTQCLVPGWVRFYNACSLDVSARLSSRCLPFRSSFAGTFSSMWSGPF